MRADANGQTSSVRRPQSQDVQKIEATHRSCMSLLAAQAFHVGASGCLLSGAELQRQTRRIGRDNLTDNPKQFSIGDLIVKEP